MTPTAGPDGAAMQGGTGEPDPVGPVGAVSPVGPVGAVGANAPRPASRHAARLRPRSVAAIALTSAVGLAAFGWPLVAEAGSSAVSHATDAPWLFALVLPLLLAVVLSEVAEGGMDAKGIALLGVLSAVVAALRPLGAGTAGLEPTWAVLVLAGRALGPGFGFALGAVSMFASALVTGGVGPWLPFQMIGAAWVGLGAGLLPPVRGRREVLLLAVYGALAAFCYGVLLNLWFWPMTAGMGTAISYQPGADPADNAVRWLAFSLATSLGYDLPRAALTAGLVALAGPAVLSALRRASRRAAFDAAPVFADGSR